MVCRKDLTAKHPEIKVPNLYVIKLMFSLKSRGYVEEKFNWWFYYWWLTNEGMEYLREHLHLPESIVPATLKAPARQERPPQSAGERPPRSAPDSYVVSSRGPQGSFPPQTKEISTSSPEFRASFQVTSSNTTKSTLTSPFHYDLFPSSLCD